MGPHLQTAAVLRLLILYNVDSPLADAGHYPWNWPFTVVGTCQALIWLDLGSRSLCNCWDRWTQMDGWTVVACYFGEHTQEMEIHVLVQGSLGLFINDFAIFIHRR